MDERSHGLILRTRPLTETSLIVHWLTPDLGRIATVARGARRPKSPFRGNLDLYYACDFSFARSRRSDLHNLREVVLQSTHEALRRNMDSLQKAGDAAALIERATETETPLPEIFALFQDFLESLTAGTGANMATILAFELKLLRELGLKPDLAKSPLKPGTRRIAQHLCEAGWDEQGILKPGPAQLAELNRFLNGFLTQHLGTAPNGRVEAVTKQIS